MTSKSREFQIFAKPAGPNCNLKCSYCYYIDKKHLYGKGNHFIMDDDILEKYVIQHIQATTDNLISFSWHGGEPLLAGINFFKKITQIQKKHQPAGSKIINGVQTNGTLLDDKWCSFFASEGFVAGMSIDGPGDLHNNNRRTKDGRSTLNQVIRGYELLKSYGVIPEILCVVNSVNVKYPLVIYKFFKELGARYMTFLPLVIPDKHSPTGATANSVPADDFGIFLSTIFDEWVEKDIGQIKIQIFEEAARTAFNQEHTLCIFKVNCGGVPVVEHSGDFYSCDHFADDAHNLGNIRDHSISWFLDSAAQKAFGEKKSFLLPAFCLECNVLQMCNGECPGNRFINTPDGEIGLNYLCSGYKYFFNHCRPFIDAIAKAWVNNAV